jgi:creatinine amidohydrolase/Fe(II)-dependent formamide hydrolase-like protein
VTTRDGAFVCLTAGIFDTPGIETEVTHPSPHAGEAETSQMLHLRPDLVRNDELTAFPLQEALFPQLASGQVDWVRPWHLYLPMSAGGETRTATAASGDALITAAADGLARFLVQLSEAPWHPRFPYAAAPAADEPSP